MSTVISIIIVVVMFVVETICVKLKSPIWGGIIPFLVLIASIYILASGLISLDLTSGCIFLALNTFVFEEWFEGRAKYKKKEKEELEKMKIQDM